MSVDAEFSVPHGAHGITDSLRWVGSARVLSAVRGAGATTGDVVRVGPPQLREIADNPEVSLHLMVRERLAETAERRRAIEAALVDVRARAAELAALDASLVRFDPAAYFDALKWELVDLVACITHTPAHPASET